MIMQHFILTRFNLCLWRKDKRGVQTQTEGWLKKRCELFERYTLPSVCGQTCQDFKWIILFDEESPAWLRERVERWRKECQALIPVGVKRMDDEKMQEAAKRLGATRSVNGYVHLIFSNAIAKHVKENQRIITTYLDNDDALHRDFVAKLQQKAAEVEHNTILSFTPGLQYYTELGIGISMDYRNNHFISLVEDVQVGKPFRTVYGFGGHYHILKDTRTHVEIIETKPEMMWVEIIHDNNVDNDVKMTTKQHLVTNFKAYTEHYTLNFYHSNSPRLVWLTRWMPRFVHQFFRRLWHKVFGHNWNL